MRDKKIVGFQLWCWKFKGCLRTTLISRPNKSKFSYYSHYKTQSFCGLSEEAFIVVLNNSAQSLDSSRTADSSNKIFSLFLQKINKLTLKDLKIFARI